MLFQKRLRLPECFIYEAFMATTTLNARHSLGGNDGKLTFAHLGKLGPCRSVAKARFVR